MFIVFNRQKIFSYLVAFSTIVILFGIAFSVTNENAVITSSTVRELPIYNVKTDQKKISLTINCAWNADDIDKILKTLKDNNVKATFFMVGSWVDKFPEEVKKIAKEGHEIANHSNTHPHVNNLSYEKNIEEIESSNDKIEKLIGKRTSLYRAPYGEYNNTVINAANSLNYYSIQWSLDTLDYTGLTENEMWNRLDGKLKKGDIILMHNGTKHTADSLELLIKNIQSKGLEIKKVSDILYKENYKINENGTQVINNSLQ